MLMQCVLEAYLTRMTFVQHQAPRTD